MPIAFSTDKTPVPDTWTAFKAVAARKSFAPQWHDDGTVYTIFGFDGPLAHVCTIWKGEVPYSIATFYSQEQNDADKTEFETSYKAKWGAPIEIRTSDGKPIVLMNLFPGDVLMNYAGAGDDNAPGNGQVFQVSRATSGDETIEWSFCDWVYIAGGGLSWSGADVGDTLTMLVYAPATPTPGTTGTANCKRTSLGGDLYRVDPASGEDATHVLDLSTAGAWTPIPAFDSAGNPNGKWDLTLPDTGKGALAPAAVANQGGYNLFEFSVTLQTFATQLPILGAAVSDITVPAIKVKKLLPRWKMKLTLHVAGERTVKAVWWLIVGRKRTQ